MKYLSFSEVSEGTLLACIGATFVLSIASWKFIETPFRKKTLFPTRKGIFLFGGIVGGIFVILGTVIYKADGIPSRFPPEVSQHKRIQSEFDFIQQLNVLLEGETLPTFGSPIEGEAKPGPLLWGDSHAMPAMPGID